MTRYIFQPDPVVTNGAMVRVSFFVSGTATRRSDDLWRVDAFDNLEESIPNGIIVAPASSGSLGTFAGPDDINTLYLQIEEASGLRTQVTAVRSSNAQPPTGGGGGGGDVPSARTITAGDGLLGGGDFSTDREISVDFGTGALQVPEGNDARFSDARTPLDHASSHTSGGSDEVTLAQAQVTGLQAALTAKADLVGGKVPSSQLPSITAGGSTFVVASQAAQTALTGAIIGDIAIRTDESKSYVLSTTPPTSFANWVELVGVGLITSVNGETGAVVLSAADVGAVATTRTVSAGTGLTGGGDLSANRSFAVSFGTTGSTVAVGNHTHDAAGIASGTISSARLPSIPISLLPAGSTLTVYKSGGTWPARPTSRADITVRWNGADPSPSIVSSGTGGMHDGIDVREIPAT